MATADGHPQHARPAVDLEQLYFDHGARVRAICASILRNREEAEDAAQQVFASALRAVHAGTVPHDAGAWLATIARHESWTRARCKPPVALPDGLADAAEEDPALTAARRVELARAWRTIGELPSAQREALLLREVRGFGYEELADDLGLSRASVRSLLHRARRTLRTKLEKGALALGSAPGLSALVRLLGDGSSPGLAPAARGAAVGIGALAITAGGAVVAPPLTGHSRPQVVMGGERSATEAPAAAPRRRVFSAPVRREDGGHHHRQAGRPGGGGGSSSSDPSAEGDAASSGSSHPGTGASASPSRRDGGHGGSDRVGTDRASGSSEATSGGSRGRDSSDGSLAAVVVPEAPSGEKDGDSSTATAETSSDGSSTIPASSTSGTDGSDISSGEGSGGLSGSRGPGGSSTSGSSDDSGSSGHGS